MFLLLTIQSFTKEEFQNFSLSLSFRVNGISSDLEERYVSPVVGQNVAPLVSRDFWCSFKGREERLRTLIFVLSELGAPRFLRQG